MMKTDSLLDSTPVLDFRTPEIAGLVDRNGWLEMHQFDKIGAVYDFVRTEIHFGYNRADDIPASEVLADGFGQCNTKATLLMALLRAVGIRCRIHGFTIHKALQRGVVPELIFPIAPAEILHSWVEVDLDGKWIKLEGFILDPRYLSSLQRSFFGDEQLCGYGAGTDCLGAPPVEWNGTDTYIQKTGIVQDLGVFDTPDAFYSVHRQNLGSVRDLLYRRVVRHWMNVRVESIRNGGLPAPATSSHSHNRASDSA